MGRVVNVSPQNAGKSEFKPIPTGTRLQATVFAIEETTVKSESSPNQGQPQLDVTFKVQETGEFFGREIRFQKIPLYDGSGAWKLTAFADAVGWPHEGGDVTLPDNMQSVVGTPLTIKVQEDPKNAKGQIFNSVSGYAPADASAGSSAGQDAPPSWSSLNGS